MLSRLSLTSLLERVVTLDLIRLCAASLDRKEPFGFCGGFLSQITILI